MSTSTAPEPASGSSNPSPINKWLPSNPFDLPETRELIAQKVAMGEITDHDVAIMEKGYKWMIYTPPATAISFTFLIWQLMKKQYPRPRLITRIFWGGLSAGAGGLLGFGAAGVAAAMEVEDKVEDVERKSLVFEEITEHSRSLQQSRLALSRPAPPPAVISPSLTPAMRQTANRGESRLPRDFEFPNETEEERKERERRMLEGLKLGQERVEEETKGTLGWVKGLFGSK
ncbi:hypothetical protein I307_02216 [Cryptococcus deuterogattii 99/473]|uniref:Uncharacterized protein n=2 Tax=Cryptococcus deuterogattii TaxID=1859096 RepID=A0A0D0UZW6_9TREE|nr:hypothetical protein CNBG_0450 [Cryptococcus deuterogattii R265]KIR27163.1 hypothetical protein I309_03873 [Cryptococcus deuterogattii LA55]KIR33667.1 hypothetical protein I352_03744 [Cryptococcus deuterogattii MMRL2647]KIR40781.1 hypothetical protein I313_03437 [Cryptococcus deuterogattii Ram5]KIR74462.1 hypothetical protein I310_02069 [Cryptococcus deuterogattii CA1014]KIR94049.1 hypothetical protein I304_01681 [Cryptococcus deuterogattii CBS 10090]KIS01056.1 hypothetical protein L804_00